jgi:hypothetical protein
VTPRTQIIVVAAVLFLAGTIDFIQRTHVPRTPAERDSEIKAFVAPDQPLPLASARERLQSWLPTTSTESQGSLVDGQNQPPDSVVSIPDRADIDGWRFILLGVFDAGPPFAVLDVMSLADREVEQVRVSAGEEIKGVRVERISGHTVDLLNEEKVIHLALFIDAKDNTAPTDESANKTANEQDE